MAQYDLELPPQQNFYSEPKDQFGFLGQAKTPQQDTGMGWVGFPGQQPMQQQPMQQQPMQQQPVQQQPMQQQPVQQQPVQLGERAMARKKELQHKLFWEAQRNPELAKEIQDELRNMQSLQGGPRKKELQHNLFREAQRNPEVLVLAKEIHDELRNLQGNQQPNSLGVKPESYIESLQRKHGIKQPTQDEIMEMQRSILQNGLTDQEY